MPEAATCADNRTGAAVAQAFQMMEEDLGRPIAEVFSSISEHPIAAASLGQVRRSPSFWTYLCFLPGHVAHSSLG